MKIIFAGLAAFCISLCSALAEPIQITTGSFGDAKQPQIAVNAENEVFVVFGSSSGVWFSSSTDGGAKFSEPTKIASVKGLALGMRRGPRVIANGTSVTVSAISHETGDLSIWNSQDRGRTWSPETVINEVPKSAREGMHGLASDGRGNAFIVWLDLREKKTQLWGSKSTDGGKTWQKNLRVYKSPDETICECCHPTVAFGANGEIIAMWRNWLNGNRDIYKSVSMDGGSTFGEATKLGIGNWPLKGCPMDGGSVAVGGQEVAYVWRRESKIFATFADDSERLISDSGAQPMIVPNGKGGFDIFWQASGNLYRKPLQFAEKFRKANSNFDRAPEPKETLFSKSAAYASAAWEPTSKAAFIVWEGSPEAKSTSVFIERIY